MKQLREACKSPFLHSGLYALVGPNHFFNKIQDAVDHEVKEGRIGAPHDWMETGAQVVKYPMNASSSTNDGGETRRLSREEDGSLTDSEAEGISSFS